jgi:hypothetical protein
MGEGMTITFSLWEKVSSTGSPACGIIKDRLENLSHMLRRQT